MNQYVNVSLSLIGLCGIVGAGVAIGSGVGMMALQAGAAVEQEQNKENAIVAHSPMEKRHANSSFAASAVAEKQ